MRFRGGPILALVGMLLLQVFGLVTSPGGACGMPATAVAAASSPADTCCSDTDSDCPCCSAAQVTKVAPPAPAIDACCEIVPGQVAMRGCGSCACAPTEQPVAPQRHVPRTTHSKWSSSPAIAIARPVWIDLPTARPTTNPVAVRFERDKRRATLGVWVI